MTPHPHRLLPIVVAMTAAVAPGVGAAAASASASAPPSEPPSSGPMASSGPSSSGPVASQPTASQPAGSESSPPEAPAELFDPAAPFDPSEWIVAVDDAGQVVVITVGLDGNLGEPFPVLDAGDGLVDGVALDADRSTAFVGVCCAPGTIHVATAEEGEIDSHDGSAPVTSPDRASLAYVVGTSIIVEDVAAGETSTIDTDDGDSFTPFDVAWIDDGRLVAFGADASQSFEFRSYDVASASLVASAPASDGAQPNFHFAGVDADGAIVVVDLPLKVTTPSALVRLDADTLTPLDAAPDTDTLPAGVLSVSLNGAATHLLWVDADGVLSIDGEPQPGATYRWAAWA